MIVEDSGLICAGAVTSYLNLALHLVEKFAGPAIAAQCARLMLIDSKQLSQAPFASLQAGWQHQDDIVSQAQSWMQRNLHCELNLDDIASSIPVSPRTLIRRFKEAAGQTPLAFLQSMRVEAAKRLLENTDLSLEMIVEKVGYSDVSSFRRLFSRTTQLTPREYRSRFGAR
jgi:transcriptional regulator GlxA family with amidase domain